MGGANPNDQVNFTSYSNDSVAGDTNTNGTNTCQPRRLGRDRLAQLRPAGYPAAQTFPVDGSRSGPLRGQAVAGEDDALSRLNYAKSAMPAGPCR